MAVHLYRTSSKARDLVPRRLERKYYLPPSKVGLAYGLLRHVCRMDAAYPCEQIHSLYFDTAELEQHERSCEGSYRKDKVRIRWYGDETSMRRMQTIFLELKSRRGFASTKRRRKLEVPADALALDRLSAGVVPASILSDTLATFGYFPTRMLLPVIKISYWRYRFAEVISGQRLSLDCRIRSTMILPHPSNGEKDLELPGAVMEIKGTRMDVPATLRQVGLLEADWGRFSKYSACIDAHAEAPGTIGRLDPSGRNPGL
jgi:hypothetical protein